MLDALLEYVQNNNRVCPVPRRWTELWEMLPERQRAGPGWKPALPLVLAAWRGIPAAMKAIRLEEHIRHASKHGKLAEVDRYLRGLPEGDWAHLSDF